MTMTLGIDTRKDILWPGIAAGLLSTAALAVCGRLHGKRATAPVSAASHWVWPQEANQTAHPKPRHLLTGLAIHQLMSIGWAAGNALAVAVARRSMNHRDTGARPTHRARYCDDLGRCGGRLYRRSEALHAGLRISLAGRPYRRGLSCVWGGARPAVFHEALGALSR
ncbi:hypothetical protein [Caballeronia cordobensis]|uniref:hypothetical protein n=1 Tax=Caballeronia cordobensis TaxID=1353886 RepID=UPI001F28EEA6|nr:hypothetical protein [Caballeronia cordobensis]